MALYPNGRYMTRSTYKGYGVAPGLDAYTKGCGDRMNRFVSESFARTASTPDGYDIKGSVPPITAGGMATLREVASFAGSASLLQGGPMEGTAGVVAMTGDGNVSLVVGMEGNAAVVSLTADNAVLKLTIGLDGNGTWTLTGTPNLAMIVPFEGAGSFSLAGTGDVRGLLSMEGEWTPFTELSPESLARAVWDSQLSNYQDSGSAGKALATASSGGVDLNAMAAAVWAYVNRTLTANPGVTTSDIVTALESAVIPVNTVQIKGQSINGSGSESDPWGP
jgi:hypothetical protein